MKKLAKIKFATPELRAYVLDQLTAKHGRAKAERLIKAIEE